MSHWLIDTHLLSLYTKIDPGVVRLTTLSVVIGVVWCFVWLGCGIQSCDDIYHFEMGETCSRNETRTIRIHGIDTKQPPNHPPLLIDPNLRERERVRFELKLRERNKKREKREKPHLLSAWKNRRRTIRLKGRNP